MKRTVVAGIALALSLALFGCAAGEQAGTGRAVLQAPITAHDVAAMSKAGISDSVITTMIAVSGSRFNLSANDVIALADSGVSHDVINAMLKAGGNVNRPEQGSVVYAYPWYPFYDYDPYWYPWYYPRYSVGLRFNYGYHGGPGHRRGRR